MVSQPYDTRKGQVWLAIPNEEICFPITGKTGRPQLVMQASQFMNVAGTGLVEIAKNLFQLRPWQRLLPLGRLAQEEIVIHEFSNAVNKASC